MRTKYKFGGGASRVVKFPPRLKLQPVEVLVGSTCEGSIVMSLSRLDLPVPLQAGAAMLQNSFSIPPSNFSISPFIFACYPTFLYSTTL